MSKLFVLAFVFVVAALVAALEADCRGGDEKPDDIFKYIRKNKQWFENVRTVLLGLKIPDDTKITEQVMVDAFNADPNKANKINWYVKTTLMNLKEHESCSEEIANALLAISQQEELERFRSFFEGYWKETLEECEKKEVEELKKEYLESYSNGALDEFFKAALGIRKPVSDEEYYGMLKKANWSNLGYNIAGVLGVVNNHPETWYENGAIVGNKNPVTKTIKFITQECWFLHPIHRSFAVANVAHLFNIASGIEIPSKRVVFNIMNEVNRICLAWLYGGPNWRQAFTKKITGLPTEDNM